MFLESDSMELGSSCVGDEEHSHHDSEPIDSPTLNDNVEGEAIDNTPPIIRTPLLVVSIGIRGGELNG
jgi:hypothetical protein